MDAMGQYVNKRVGSPIEKLNVSRHFLKISFTGKLFVYFL